MKKSFLPGVAERTKKEPHEGRNRATKDESYSDSSSCGTWDVTTFIDSSAHTREYSVVLFGNYTRYVGLVLAVDSVLHGR